MKNIFKGFALATSMLTTIPFFKIHDFSKGINGYSVMSYPLVGFFLGLILYAFYALLAPYIPSFHLGVILFSLWVYLTGALHIDGFCDTVDGLYVPKERALEVMKDPHNGGMGMTFGAVLLILKASSIVHLQNYALLPLVLMLPRLATVFAIYFAPYVSPNGMSSFAKEELKLWQVWSAFFYTLLVVYYYDAWVLLIVSFILLCLIYRFFMKRYGGFTGDIYGFSIELIELALLNAIIVGLV